MGSLNDPSNNNVPFHQLVYYCYSDALQLSFNHTPHTPGIEAAKDVTFFLYYH